MEQILGQPTKFQRCTKLSSLTEIVSTVDSSIEVVVISCMTGIVATMCGSGDVKGTIVRSMTMLGASLRDLCRHRLENLQVFVAPCTPRTTTDFQTHSKFAMVTRFIILWGHHWCYTYLFMFFQRCLSDETRDLFGVSIMNWVSSYEVRSDGTVSDPSCKQFLEDLLRALRTGLGRHRTSSGSSSSSASSTMSSTPKKSGNALLRTDSMDSDMRYMQKKPTIVIFI